MPAPKTRPINKKLREGLKCRARRVASQAPKRREASALRVTKNQDRAGNKSAQSEQKNKGSEKAESQRDKGSSAQREEPKAERNKSADKSPRDDEKPEGKATQSKAESKANDKSAADSKSDSPSSKSAERDKSKSDDKGDGASGTSSGEAGTSTPGKLTEDKKKNDEVKRVQISGEKRDRIQAGFKSHGDVKRVTDVNVNISVGSRASRDWAFVPVPMAVIEIVPEYRGYVFAYVGDDYVVCDPDTYEIVAVLPASGSGGGYASSSSSSAQCSPDLTLSDEDRRDIIQSIEMTNEVSVSGVSVGWAVPQDIEVRPLPPRVVDRLSRLEACRYFIVDDQIAIVDPDQDKVVLMIEHD